MNFKKLCEGLTRQQFNDIAENWYARLNKLKQYHIANPNSLKAAVLVMEMIKRMEVIAKLYTQVNMPRIPKYRSGIL